MTLTYDPMPKQVAFHESKAPVRILLGGNRAGRTTALMQEVGVACETANVIIAVLAEGNIGRTVYPKLFTKKFARGPIVPDEKVEQFCWIKKAAGIFSSVKLRDSDFSIRAMVSGSGFQGLVKEGTVLAIDEEYDCKELIEEVLSRGGRVIATFWHDSRGLAQFRTIPKDMIETFRLLFTENTHIPQESRDRVMRLWEWQGPLAARTRNEGRFP